MSEEENRPAPGLGRQGWGMITAVWLVAAVAWTPAAHLGGQPQTHSFAALAGVFLQMLVHFAPWALAMPFFLRLSRRFPIGLGRSLRSILLFALLGLVVVPLFTAAGVAAGRLLGAATGGFAGEIFAGFGRATLITGLFALPTYVAVVAIGQTVAYFERYRERERLLSRSRSEALRAQIAPHFLFNALNAISALGYSDPAQADRAMVRLAGLLRETLDRPDWTSLREEIALVADYVELHRLLLGERLRFELRIAPEAWDGRLPAMLLQPLVENALVHGLSRLPDGGALTVRAACSPGMVEIEIVNDAPPASGEAPAQGIGLANVRRRLAAAYGDAARLEFERESQRARARLLLPFEAQQP